MFKEQLFKHPKVLELKPKIGLSQCLVGDNVRYNAKTKRQPFICDYLKNYAELIPICPEVGAGLSTPRPAVQLISSSNKLLMQGVKNSDIDVTDAVQNFNHKIAQRYQGTFQAFIFKARSPSCGLDSSPVFNNEGLGIAISSGIFAATIKQHWNDCLLLEEEQLNSEEQCQQLLLECYLLMDKQWTALKSRH